MTSWFADLTSKAEAMLVKLDQDAAQALQGREGLINKTRLFTNDTSEVDLGVRNGTQSDVTQSEPDLIDSFREDDTNLIDITYVNDEAVKGKETLSSHDTIVRSDLEQSSPIYSTQISDLGSSTKHMENVSGNRRAGLVEDHLARKALTNTRRFPIQASLNKPPIFRASKESTDLGRGLTNSKPTPTKKITSFSADIRQPQAEDIRASINRSLQEYVSKSPSEFTESRPHSVVPQSYHFDDRPTLIRHPSDTVYDNFCSDTSINQPSFRIELPEDDSLMPDKSSVAIQLLRQSAIRKKSTSQIHKVLGRLTGIDKHSEPFLSDKTRIKLRRLQWRAATLARRLNYYSRVYPRLKYFMLVYLLLMQLLVIYVLFFYQSSGSTTDLSSQIKQQQQELRRSEFGGQPEQAGKG